MNKKEICILIPIYKKTLNFFEIQSVEQCVKVLSNYTIHFVCPKELNIDFYKENFSGIVDFTYFENYYFKDLASYNRLMLSVGFYKAFDKYKYMLIHQTDCYVFRDELLDWALKGFDYTGGLWFDDYTKNPEDGAEIWFPGNGGLSLRNITNVLELLNSKRPLKMWREIIAERKMHKKFNLIQYSKILIVNILNLFGYQNNSSFIAKYWNQNEDGFIFEMHSKYGKLTIPTVKESVFFSWDRRPDYLFDKFAKLPFGCHAWYREDYPYEKNKNFWLEKIKLK